VSQAAHGEQLVARIRWVVVGMLLLVPLREVMQHPSSPTTRLLLLLSVIALAVAVGEWVLWRPDRYYPWVGFLTSIVDVTLVSMLLLAFVVVGRPHMAVNSRVLYSVYLVVIATTGLRYDARISVLVGLLAMAEYGGVVAYADARWDLNHPSFEPFVDGRFDLGLHYARLALIGAATWISTETVLRTQRLRRTAAKDPLTGLLNRGMFDELAEAELARSRRHERPLSIILLDIDHFKLFNDTYGHIVGDEVLRAVADMLRSGRQSDLAARYGGEEFILLLPETDTQAASDHAEHLRETIAASTVTVSIGVAGVPDDGTDLRTVIDRADYRLYEAKAGGRNRTVGPAGVAAATV